MKKWMGSKPKCDFCGEPEPIVFVDGKTVYGPWAIMCMCCYSNKGVGLGPGKGQRYERSEDGTYPKVEG